MNAAPPVDVPARPPRRRTVVAAVLGTLAVVALTISLVAGWAASTVLRSEEVGDLAADALALPEAQEALAAYITGQLAGVVDLDATLQTLLPDRLGRLSPVLADGALSAVDRTLVRAFGDEDVQQAIVTMVERAHDATMNLLRGDGLIDGVSVNEGRVTLNTLPLVARGLTRLQSIGLLSDVEIPTVTAAGDPEQQLAELSSALGRDLPPDFGQLVVYESARVAEAQQTVQNGQRLLALAERALPLLIALTVVLLVATMLVAPRRWRAALVLGLSVAAAMVVLRSFSRRLVDDVPELARSAGGRAALTAIVDGATTSLKTAAGVMLIVALAVVAAVLLRTRRRTDLVLVAAVAAGAATFAVFEFSVLAMGAGVLVAIVVIIGAARPLPTSTAATP
jgi:hypothetical protein